ncbi:MAG: MaoC family dehydratase N-terminal domain-containing protein [Notoacmeibacter sp.]|nr:MaoC family dehydratase N-terminal domain-containing protein [Notoacmeibacter sp.]
MADGAFGDWLGRVAVQTDRFAADPVIRLGATLNRDWTHLDDGSELFPLAHWLHFLPREPMDALGPDGHAARGGFLPAVDGLPRRMWAGSRLTFANPLRAGTQASRRSTVTSIQQKNGTSGPLLFVTVTHDISDADGTPLLTDEHDIVYRGAARAGASNRAPDGGNAGNIRRSLVPDPVMLFRYSALTFNGHRIHYDRSYVTCTEGYPGLVVHGPLIATLLLDHAMAAMPGARPTRFSFRARSPAFDGNELTLHADQVAADGTMVLRATNHDGGLVMNAEAGFAP